MASALSAAAKKVAASLLSGARASIFWARLGPRTSQIEQSLDPPHPEGYLFVSVHGRSPLWGIVASGLGLVHKSTSIFGTPNLELGSPF